MEKANVIEGIIIEYFPYDNKSRVNLNHALFGRLVYRTRRGKKIAYYILGMLDNTRFARLLNSKIFIEKDGLKVLKHNLLTTYGHIKYTKQERDISSLHLKTARDHWKQIVDEKGFVFHTCRKKEAKNG